MTPKGQIIKGYKATNGKMQCLGFQYELGKWYEHDGLIKLCNSGFHFCPHLSGVWSYYNDSDTRIFEVEAEEVENKFEPGADLKYVAKRIRFIGEVKVGGDGNTGDRNTGYRNTGDRNTGYRNTGNGNTGYWNTGYWNTGNWNTGNGNTGYGNTGYRNTGDRNTGNGNTGDRNTGNGNTGDRNTGNGNTGYGNTGDRNTGNGNTGDRNTGYRNTGDRNTGYRNTGYGNTGDRNTGDGNTGDGNTGNGNVGDKHAGFLNIKPEPIIIFDQPFTGKLTDEINELIYDLSCALMSDDPICPDSYLKIPNATIAKIKKLHQAHIDARNKGNIL